MQEKITIAISLFITIFLFSYAVAFVSTSSQCLKNGYKSAKVDIFFNQYCIKRVEQTDIVVPLNTVILK